MSEKVVMPPTHQLFLPLAFWLDVIANLDKRVEIMCAGSGYGMVTVDIKLRDGRVYEVGIEEKTAIRGLVRKAGNLAEESVVKQEVSPAIPTEGNF